MIQLFIEKRNMQGRFPSPLALISRKKFLCKTLYKVHWVMSSTLCCNKRPFFFFFPPEKYLQLCGAKDGDFFPPLCWRHNIKSDLSDGISAGSWADVAEAPCFLMIYLNRRSLQNLEKWTACAGCALKPRSGSVGAIPWLNSHKYLKASDSLCVAQTHIFHFG